MGWFSRAKQVEHDALTEAHNIGQYALGMFDHVKSELIEANGFYADVKQEATNEITRLRARYDEAHAAQTKNLGVVERLKTLLGETDAA